MQRVNAFRRFGLLAAAAAVLFAVTAREGYGARRVVNLDGTWQVAEGTMERVPESFDHAVCVPGLVDMAKPAFEEVGRKSQRREAFWYRRTFRVDGNVPRVAYLMIRKARYGTRVFLNGRLVGDHLPCFTPAILDVREALRGGGDANVLVVRVGADRESRPTDVPSGWDFEKYLYIPGIYDSVELILSDGPYIRSVQTAPNIDLQQVRIVAEIEDAAAGEEVAYSLTEVRSGKRVAQGRRRCEKAEDGIAKLDFAVDVEDMHLWSPEDPFLYAVELKTAGDNLTARFGMRSFRFDPATKRAILNGKTYMMRGTNVCIYRFFEDESRGDRPWRAEWVRRLHRKFKGMQWNSIRYCIGFPPDFWYDIADEEGFLIQDEFPIWLLSGAPENPRAEKIIPEYTAWMRHRWNHACVVIWDAQNESVTPETGKAIGAVRHLDLSNRPWENGWAEPQAATDCVEAHPYLFSRATWTPDKPFYLPEIAGVSGVPHLRDEQKKFDVPIIINEYAWLWLDRKGDVTSLTGNVYKSLLEPDSTAEQRRVLYAKYLAALTEFWRCHRQCAGVLHFCGLAYSRRGDLPRPEGGATSDHFIDIEELTFEPNFEKYVTDAFAPAGLMLDFWDTEMEAGRTRDVDVVVINDLYEGWNGQVRLTLAGSGGVLLEKSRPLIVAPLGKEICAFEFTTPTVPGRYTLKAELLQTGKKPTASWRDFEVKAADK